MQSNKLFDIKVLYILCYVISISLYSLIAKQVQNKEHAYTFNVTVVVLLTEILKLFFSILMFQFTHNRDSLPIGIQHSDPKPLTFLAFCIPAFLYTVRNNLQFLNLSRMDFEAYKLLSNFQFIISGLLGLIMMNQKLSPAQWSALFIITGACVLIDFDPELQYSITALNTILLLVQVLCSSSASLLVEMLLKAHHEVNIDYQNMYMYTFSVIFNLIFLGGKLVEYSENKAGVVVPAILDITNPIVLLLSVIGAIGGVITNRVLKYMGATTKSFAMACEMILTSFLASWLFHVEFSRIVLLTLLLMVISIVLYNIEPKIELESVEVEKATMQHME